MYSNKTRLHVGARFYFALAAVLLIIPVQWIIAWMFAAVVHELGHYTAVRACGYQVFTVNINLNGALMETEPLGNGEWICALAGPICGLLLLLTSKWFPRIAICALIQSAFNLLPIETMDGGRALSGIFTLLFSSKAANRIVSIVSHITLITITLIVIDLSFRFKLGVMPLFLIGGFIGKLMKIKFPCKDSRLRVQ